MKSQNILHGKYHKTPPQNKKQLKSPKPSRKFLRSMTCADEFCSIKFYISRNYLDLFHMFSLVDNNDMVGNCSALLACTLPIQTDRVP
jgi:hypothetical protein